MDEIICECGHELDEHDIMSCTYSARGDCNCGLSLDAVEARYWARRMREYMEWWHAACATAFADRDIARVQIDRNNLTMLAMKASISNLNERLEIAMEAIRKSERLLDNNFGYRSQEAKDAWNILTDALAEIKKLEGE